MLHFIADHLGTILQLAATAWLAYVARTFQITLAVYGTRLEAHREVMRRARVLWWLKKDAPVWVNTMNEMMDWHAVNEVYLTRTAAQAFLDVHLWKGMEGHELPPGGTKDYFKNADRALKTLRTELLRFRKRTFLELLQDGGRWLLKRDKKKRSA